MRPEDIERLIKQTPFVPFRIHLSNGMHVDIKHRDYVFMGRSRMEVGTPVNEESSIMEEINYYAYVHMVRIEMLERQQSAAV